MHMCVCVYVCECVCMCMCVCACRYVHAPESIQSFVNISPHILQDMRQLDLTHNKLDGSACDMLAKAVPSMSRLEELWLNGNPIGSGGTVDVIKALCGSGVKRLLLSSTGIREPDCEALCELLK